MATLISNSGIQFIEWTGSFDFTHLKDTIRLNYRSVFAEIDDVYGWSYDELTKVDGRSTKAVCFANGNNGELKDCEFPDGPEWYRTSYLNSIEKNNIFGVPEFHLEPEIRKFESDGGQRVDDNVLESLSNHRRTLLAFSKKWIPLPYCKETQMGIESRLSDLPPPRIYIDEIAENKFHFVIAVQTNGSNPKANVDENRYALTSNINSILEILKRANGGSWIDEYLKSMIYGDSAEKASEEKAKHIANYILLVKAVESAFSNQSSIEFAPSNVIQTRSVDCFIDLGNSNTCVILCEESEQNDPERVFKNSAHLELRDFTNPIKSYTKPFPSKIVFSKPRFINRDIPFDKFIWPSPLRIGNEADTIISNEKMKDWLFDYRSHCSSPKRYLCDDEPSQFPWRFANTSSAQSRIDVSWPPTDNKINNVGEYNEEYITLMPHYSRSSLNRFAFIEIFAQAISQINSVKFREQNGDVFYKRLIRNIVISCPTGMNLSDQALLRTYAEEALKILYKNDEETPNVIPDPASLNKLLRNPDSDRPDWMYDEATTTQIMFMYSELNHECKGHADLYNNLYGKNGSVRVASIDIGGGTSDLMICDYTANQNNGVSELQPKPLFWDSYYRAGDDFQKSLIEEMVIKGDILSHGGELVKDRIKAYFDMDAQGDGARSLAMRVAFIQQVGLPVSQWIMDCSNLDDTEQIKSFDDLFANSPIDHELLRDFHTKLGFNLSDITFSYNKEKFEKVLMNFFSKQVNTMLGIVSSLESDVLLLSGGTLRILQLEELFRKGFNLSQCRIVNINNWEPGGWHPFRDDNTGTISDSKSSVAIGSLISFWGKNNKIPGFKIDDNWLTANELKGCKFVLDKRATGEAPKILLSDDDKTYEAEITTMQLPIVLHTSPIGSPNYIHKRGYKVDWDISGLLGSKVDLILNNSQNFATINKKKEKILKLSPLTFSLEKNSASEEIKILEVQGDNGDTINERCFSISPYSLQLEGYWLDNGFDINY